MPVESMLEIEKSRVKDHIKLIFKKSFLKSKEEKPYKRRNYWNVQKINCT